MHLWKSVLYVKGSTGVYLQDGGQLADPPLALSFASFVPSMMTTMSHVPLTNCSNCVRFQYGLSAPFCTVAPPAPRLVTASARARARARAQPPQRVEGQQARSCLQPCMHKRSINLTQDKQNGGLLLLGVSELKAQQKKIL